MFFCFFFFFFQAGSFLSEAQFPPELPETLDPLFKFHETIAKVRPSKVILPKTIYHCGCVAVLSLKL